MEPSRGSGAHPVERAFHRGARERFRAEVLSGLAARPRTLPSRYFYDARGSQLFQWITNLPGYYLTRVEREILEANAEAILAPLQGGRCTVVDLGAGDGHKTMVLLRTLASGGGEVTYAPVDVSPAALAEAAARARADLPGVAVRPVQASWARALRLLSDVAAGPKLVLFLGSSIGNLEHDAARALLGGLRRALRRGDLALVGFDLVKPRPLLRAAYDDPTGVTRAFNLNLLVRINRELGADFEPAAFRHLATWDPVRPAMESWLVSTRRQEVHLGPAVVALARGERIHTEISCKYTGAQIAALAAAAGFAEVARWTDGAGWFVDALWRAEG
jgi:L-histidine Nalpha-methyltransferase